MTNTNIEIDTIKKMIARFEEIWIEEAVEHLYIHSGELKSIADKIHSKKLSDAFLLQDLTEEERKILDEKIYIIAHL